MRTSILIVAEELKCLLCVSVVVLSTCNVVLDTVGCHLASLCLNSRSFHIVCVSVCVCIHSCLNTNLPEIPHNKL